MTGYLECVSKRTECRQFINIRGFLSEEEDWNP